MASTQRQEVARELIPKAAKLHIVGSLIRVGSGIALLVWAGLGALWSGLAAGNCLKPVLFGCDEWQREYLVAPTAVATFLVWAVIAVVVLSPTVRERMLSLGQRAVAVLFWAGFMWLVGVAVLFPSTVQPPRLEGSDAFFYWVFAGLPALGLWMLAAVSARTAAMRRLSRYAGLAVVLSLVFGSTVGQISGYVTCDLELFEPCHSWSQEGRILGGVAGIAIGLGVTWVIYLNRRHPRPAMDDP